MKLLTFSCFLLCLQSLALAQTDPLTQVHGARGQGMGNLRVHGMDVWSYFNNPGGLAKLEYSALGFGISRFGGKLFNQQSLGVAFANQLGIVSIGGRLEWHQTQIESFGTGNGLIFSIGGIAELSPEFSIGASIFNLNRSKISRNSDTRLPTGVVLGIFYNPTSQVQIHLEAEKDIQIKPIVKAGLEYGVKDWVFLRAGINSNPSRMFFGIGLKSTRFTVDYTYGQNHALGSTSHVSLGLSFSKK